MSGKKNAKRVVFSMGTLEFKILKVLADYGQVCCSDLNDAVRAERKTDNYVVCNRLVKKGWIKNTHRKFPHVRGRASRFVGITTLGRVAYQMVTDFQLMQDQIHEVKPKNVAL